MSKEEMQQQILDAITSGKIQVTNINFGDHVEHQHKIEKVEAGGVGFQIFEAHSAHSESKQVEDITPISSSVASEFDSDIPDSIIFTKKAHQEHKIPTIVQALQKSIIGRKDKTRALVQELQSWQNDGYVDANYNAQVMFDELQKILPLPFGYEVFKKHYNNTRY